MRCEHLLDLATALALNRSGESKGVESVFQICFAATQIRNDDKNSGKSKGNISWSQCLCLCDPHTFSASRAFLWTTDGLDRFHRRTPIQTTIWYLYHDTELLLRKHSGAISHLDRPEHGGVAGRDVVRCAWGLLASCKTVPYDTTTTTGRHQHCKRPCTSRWAMRQRIRGMAEIGSLCGCRDVCAAMRLWAKTAAAHQDLCTDKDPIRNDVSLFRSG